MVLVPLTRICHVVVEQVTATSLGNRPHHGNGRLLENGGLVRP